MIRREGAGGLGKRLAVAVALATLASGEAQARPSPPCGIYVLDSAAGPNRDANIRTYPFVTGYVLRTTWGALETAPGVYDFAMIDHVVRKLQGSGKKLSLELFGPTPAPKYLTEDPRVTTWRFVDKNPRHPGTAMLPMPWDAYALERFAAFLGALGDHRVPDQAAGGRPTPLREHPVFANLNAGMPGLRALGMPPPYSVTDLPGFSPEKFRDAVLRNLNLATSAFPDTVVYMGIQSSLRLRDVWDDIRAAIVREFDGVKKPKVGLFEENLAASRDPVTGAMTGRPHPEYARQLYLARDQAFIMFQALTSWTRPFMGQHKVRGATAVDGIKYGHETFKARYFELYVGDVDELGNWPAFEEWHKRLCRDLRGILGTRPGIFALRRGARTVGVT